MSSIRLPQFEFLGPYQDPNLVASAIDHLETRFVELPPELPMDTERYAQLQAINNSLLKYGESLGLELTNRITPLNRIHFMDTGSMELLYRRYPHQRGATGLRLTSGDIIAMEFPADELNQSLSFIQHEAIHNFGDKALELVPADNGWSIEERKSGWGYQNGAMHGMNEYLTERINSKVIDNYWPDDPALQNMTDFKPSTFMSDVPQEMNYRTLMTFGDAWAEKVTEALGPGAMDEVERSYFTGDVSIQHAIDEALDECHTLILSKLRTHLPRDIGATAAMLGIEYQQ